MVHMAQDDLKSIPNPSGGSCHFLGMKNLSYRATFPDHPWLCYQASLYEAYLGIVAN